MGRNPPAAAAPTRRQGKVRALPRATLPRATGRRGAALRTAVLWAALLPALAACVDNGTDGTAAGTASVAGTWEAIDGACRQTLALPGDGTFGHGLAIADGGDVFISRVDGAQGGSLQGADGTTVHLAAARPLVTAPVVDCAAWQDANRVTLPFATVAADTGVDPAALAWRGVHVPGVGLGLIGNDPAAAADRFALLRDATDTLRGFAPDAGLAPGVTLFHREPQLRPNPLPGLKSYPALHLPDEAFAESYPDGGSTTDVLARLALDVHGATALHIAPWPTGDVELCTLTVLEDPEGTQAVDPNPLGSGNAARSVVLNPGDPDAFFLSVAVPSPEGETHHVLAVLVQPASAAPCGVRLWAQPLVARRAGEHAATAAAGDPIAVALPPGAAFAIARPSHAPGLLRPLPLQGAALPWGTLTVSAAVVQPPPAAPDVLGLRTASGASVQLSVDAGGGTRFLNVFGDGGSLGPLAARAAPLATALPTLPAALPVALAVTWPPGTAQERFRLALTTATLLELSTDGGTATTGTLVDARGRRIARARGNAADGAGLRLVAALGAGSYDLVVDGAAGAAFTLHIAEATPPAMAEPALAACLLQATPAGGVPGDLRGADCAARGIAQLTGIAPYDQLRALRLDDNPLADLTPLSGHVFLRALSLARTPVGDLTPLQTLPRLRALSLAGSVLGASHVTALTAPGWRLTRLNLAGATGLSDGELADIEAALPNTLLVRPDGTLRFAAP